MLPRTMGCSHVPRMCTPPSAVKCAPAHTMRAPGLVFAWISNCKCRKYADVVEGPTTVDCEETINDAKSTVLANVIRCTVTLPESSAPAVVPLKRAVPLSSQLIPCG